MYTATPEEDWTPRGATTPNLLVADGKLTVGFVLAQLTVAIDQFAMELRLRLIVEPKVDDGLAIYFI